jgi:hypothetical protein
VVSWTSITDAIRLALSGDRISGRAALQDCWAATAGHDHAQRCVIAHYLADTQDHVEAEVAWDERALAEHGPLRDGDLADLGIPSVLAFLPSLHLNLGDGHLRLGHVEQAQLHLRSGLAAAKVLDDDGYGAMIRGGLARLQARVDDACETAVRDQMADHPPSEGMIAPEMLEESSESR